MTEYEIMKQSNGTYLVRSMDEDGSFHETEFRGNLAEERAAFYAAHMNKVHSTHVSFPGE